MNRGTQTLATRIDEVLSHLIDQGHFRMQSGAYHFIQPRHIRANQRKDVFFGLSDCLSLYNHLCVQCLLTIAKCVFLAYGALYKT